jgi:hypothetical protein
VKKKVVALGIVGLMGLGLAACSRDEKGLGDAPVGKRHEAPREVIVMPDKFANVAMACDGHGHRIFATTRDAVVWVMDDPSCPGGAQ